MTAAAVRDEPATHAELAALKVEIAALRAELAAFEARFTRRLYGAMSAFVISNGLFAAAVIVAVKLLP